MKPTKNDAEKAIITLLKYLGEDPTREGLIETPARFIRAFDEYCQGYKQDPAEILNTTFEDTQNYRDMVVLRDIKFQSFCEHHLALFTGEAHIAYIPDEKVVGISKMARLVDCFANRLQIQETLTMEIADSLVKHLQPLGVAVILKSHHTCIGCRGARKPDSQLITTNFSGQFEEIENQDKLFRLLNI